MRLHVLHTTRYIYPTPATESHNEVRLMPLSDADQTCLDFQLVTTPPARIFAYDLPTGRVHHFNLRAPHSELIIVAETLVATRPRDPFADLQLASEDSEFYTREGLRQRYAEYLAATERVTLHPETDRIAVIARRQASGSTASFLIALTRLLHRVITYAPGTPHVSTSLQHALEQKSGALQDFVHLMLSVCRRQGIPARYVSGYLFSGERKPAAPGVPETRQAQHFQERRQMADTSSSRSDEDSSTPQPPAPDTPGIVLPWSGEDTMHAWVECLLPDGNWHGFDPINNLLTGESYIKVHYGRDYGDVTPVRGIYHGPFAHTVAVSVRVTAEPT